MNADNKKFIDENKIQGVKLGYGKVSNTENEIDKLNDLNKQKYKFKRNTISLKKKVTNGNDNGDDNYKPKHAGDQFGGKKYKKSSKKN